MYEEWTFDDRNILCFYRAPIRILFEMLFALDFSVDEKQIWYVLFLDAVYNTLMRNSSKRVICSFVIFFQKACRIRVYVNIRLKSLNSLSGQSHIAFAKCSYLGTR